MGTMGTLPAAGFEAIADTIMYRWSAERDVWVSDAEVLEAFQLLGRTEGIIPALESAHAIAWVAREAGKAIPSGSTVLINLSGRGDKDVAQVREILQG